MRAALVVVALVALLAPAAAAPTVVTAATVVSWDTFYAHEIAAATRESDYRDALYAAAGARDIGAFATAARNLYRLGKAEAAWLTSHRPQSCYRDWWAMARNYWTQVRQASSDFVKAAQRLDSRLIRAGAAHLDRAQVYLDRMETHLPTC